jgi:putative SOS response-associated peptidase YedK
MCGRYALYGPKSRSRYEQAYFKGLEQYPDRYNVAPTDVMPIVRLVDGEPNITPARWGLIPYWAKDIKIGFSTINARAETIAKKPAFREAYEKRRCLVPGSGYYEWAKHPNGKRPYYFTSRDGELLTFAGLWEKWKPKEGEPIISYTIIVCAAACRAVWERPRNDIRLVG